MRTVEEIINSKLPKKLKPVRRFVIGKAQPHPYFYPFNYEPYFIREVHPKRLVRRNKEVSIFGKKFSIGWPVKLHFVDLGFKTKWTASDYRFEWLPAITLYFFGLMFRVYYVSPIPELSQDEYYEQLLFTLHHDCDLEVAKGNWGWVYAKTSKNTFKLDEYS